MFSQKNLSLSDYREKYSNIIQVVISYNVKNYERDQLKDIFTEKYPAQKYNGHLNMFGEEYPKCISGLPS